MPAVTAGLKCAPETPPNALTATESASPWASAMPTMPSPPPTAGVFDKIAAMPAKHRKNVPMNSARGARSDVIGRVYGDPIYFLHAPPLAIDARACRGGAAFRRPIGRGVLHRLALVSRVG